MLFDLFFFFKGLFKQVLSIVKLSEVFLGFLWSSTSRLLGFAEVKKSYGAPKESLSAGGEKSESLRFAASGDELVWCVFSFLRCLFFFPGDFSYFRCF